MNNQQQQSCRELPCFVWPARPLPYRCLSRPRPEPESVICPSSLPDREPSSSRGSCPPAWTRARHQVRFSVSSENTFPVQLSRSETLASWEALLQRLSASQVKKIS